MNKFDLKNYIGIFNDAISLKTCSSLVNESINFDWELFTWTKVSNRTYGYANNKYEVGCDTCENLPSKFKLILHPLVSNLIDQYTLTYAPNVASTSGFTPVKLNRYSTGTHLEKHVDHIHSIFDGQKKGIPTFSIVGLLNEDFEGGEFVFWDDYVVPLKTGTVIIFPSNFLYPHKVNKITKGIRHSFVSWVW